MFGSDQIKSITVVIADPAADNKQIHLWKAPNECTILSANIVCQNAQGAGSAGSFALHNFGTAGTAVGGTVAAALGGTAAASRLSASTPAAYTISDGYLEDGEWLVLDYQEVGDWVEQNVSITWDYVTGKGS